MNSLVKKVSKDDLITEYLRIMNGLLRLTDKELEVFAFIVGLDLNWVDDGQVKNVANTKNRKLMMRKLGLGKDNLSRYIRIFKDKNLLKVGPSEDGLYVNKAILPDVINDRLQLTFVLKTI